jgi:hypothetical protein
MDQYSLVQNLQNYCGEYEIIMGNHQNTTLKGMVWLNLLIKH